MKLLYNLKLTAASLGLTCLATIMNQTVFAQQNPFAASYFQNQYLANPAMVGGTDGTKANAGYRKQWAGISNSPYSLYATGEYSKGDKVNIGVNLFSDKAGMITTNTAMLTYAYYLPVTEAGGRVHLGISAGATSRSIDLKNFNGEQGDVLLSEGNSFDVDGGIGVAYTDKKFTVQASFPNMVSYFKKDYEDVINRPTFFAAAAYKISIEDDAYVIEPKVAFRGMKGFDNILDLGANVSWKELNLFGLYHTSKSFTVGAGVKLIDKLVLSAMYTTPGSSITKEYSDGSFELGIGFFLNNKK